MPINKLWNGYRGLAVRTTADYANLTGTKFLWIAQPGDAVQLSPLVEDVTENFGVPHLQKMLDRAAPKRIYDQTLIDPPEGWDFVPLMYRKEIVPLSLRGRPKYKKAISLVEQFYTKNGFTNYCRSRGFSDLIPPTVIFEDGSMPRDLPFAKCWIKRDIEQKLPGIKSVMPLASANSNWRKLLKEFLEQDIGAAYQIQEHYGEVESRLMSPCLQFQQNEYKMLFVSDPVIDDDHSSGSQIPGNDTSSAEQFGAEFYQSLADDGYLGALNTDIIWDSIAGSKMIEYNFRYGGSHIPWLIMKEIKQSQAYYKRECAVSDGFDTKDVFLLLDKLNLAAFRWGDMARQTGRHIGLVGFGIDARKNVESIASILNDSK